MKKEYILAFSSFYKAAYAQEKLAERGIRSTVKKLPPELMRSCGYALYLYTASIENAAAILNDWEIDFRGVYEVISSNGKITYQRVL